MEHPGADKPIIAGRGSRQKFIGNFVARLLVAANGHITGGQDFDKTLRDIGEKICWFGSDNIAQQSLRCARKRHGQQITRSGKMTARNAALGTGWHVTKHQTSLPELTPLCFLQITTLDPASQSYVATWSICF